MAEERNTRREILKKVLTLGPLAAAAAVFGNGAKPAAAQTIGDPDVTVTGNLTVNGTGNSSFANGKVGVGTPTPGTKLDVLGGAGNPLGDSVYANLLTARFKALGTDSQAYIQVEATPSSANAGYLIQPGNAAGGWGIVTNNSTYLRLGYASAAYNAIGTIKDGSAGVTIDTSGNVGIGTASPTVKLRVVGGDTAVWLEDSRSVENGRGLAIQWRQKDYLSTGRTLGTMGTYVEDWTTAPDIAGYMAFRTMPNVASGDVERMRITSTGDVGIGTQTPVAKLDVVGDIRLTGSVLPVGGGVFEGKARRSCYDT